MQEAADDMCLSPLNNSYPQYYLGQQTGRGMDFFQGGSWQKGYGQTGYGLGGLFRSIARVAMPAVKSGAKALGKIGLNSGVNLLGDVLSGENLKTAAKARAREGVGMAKDKAVRRVQTFVQTGRESKKRRRRQPKRQAAKKRKASKSRVRSTSAKRRKTSPEDIFC